MFHCTISIKIHSLVELLVRQHFVTEAETDVNTTVESYIRLQVVDKISNVCVF